MVDPLFWFYLLSAVAVSTLCVLSWDMIDTLGDLDHAWISRKALCDDLNTATPFVILPHWVLNILFYLCGQNLLAVIFLPLSLLYIVQYRQRMCDSGYSYHNPIGFYSEKHVRGLKTLFYTTSVFYAASTVICIVGIVHSKINRI